MGHVFSKPGARVLADTFDFAALSDDLQKLVVEKMPLSDLDQFARTNHHSQALVDADDRWRLLFVGTSHAGLLPKRPLVALKHQVSGAWPQHQPELRSIVQRVFDAPGLGLTLHDVLVRSLRVKRLYIGALMRRYVVKQPAC
ncbi:MAG: hypothetical protein EOO40_07510 [Deltaproteobacteria bacterium]|nr:MAG: hypothetical protein EOO40_07510 [Deltaproteobacteria bacterium]